MKIRGMLWDLGGVLLRTEDQSFRRQWEARLGLRSGALHDLVFQSDACRQASLGQADSAGVWESVASQLGLSQPEVAQLEQDFWAGDIVDHELVGIIRELRGQFRTALLSNAWSEVRQQVESEWLIADAFDEIVLSAEVGLAKPDPSIFQLALDRVGLAPQAALFIDDDETNVQAASDLGMQVLLFRNRDDCLSQIQAITGQG